MTRRTVTGRRASSDRTLRRLRARLRELEDVLRAIRTGEVDAVVVQGTGGEQIYSVTNADRPYRIFVETMQEGAVTLTATGEILYCNRRFAELVGMPIERVIGGELARFLPAENEQLRTMLADGTGKAQLMLKADDGTLIPVSIAVSPFIVAGVSSTCVVVTDLTQRQAEEARTTQLIREQAARAHAEAENRTKDDFLAVLSHELRTPLTAIVGWLRMLQSRNLDAAKAAYALEVIDRNVRIQTALINDLLDVSRITSGKLIMTMNRVPLPPTVEVVLDAVAPAATAKDVTIHRSLNALMAEVHGDPERLQQIVANLLSNALKFTPAGGRIDVAVEADGGRARLTVSDNGCGIPPDLLPHIFERFRQGDTSTTRSEGGLGLGRAIVRHLVEAHGGSVTAASAGKGMGATFTVELPLLDPAPKAHPHGPRPHARVRGARVLLVDDHRDTLDTLASVMTLAGMDVQATTSAHDAHQILEQFSPDVIVCDISMPVEDGLAFLAKVRARQAKIPAIAISAYTGPENRQRAVGGGFDDHLPKPVEPSELIRVIAATLRRRHPPGDVASS
jgi:PAS domain S-box-containing protein